MTVNAGTIKETCAECGSTLVLSKRHCPTCNNDAGFPNVRQFGSENNLKILQERYDKANAQANSLGFSSEFTAFENKIKYNSTVVLSMSAGIARNIFDDPRFIYSNYEALVGAEARKPAEQEDDRHRCAVGGILFGSYADKIIYGVLSLTNEGLPTYGTVYCRLRPVAVNKRTSFLETNSYKFIEAHNLVAGKRLPVGFSSNWDTKHYLVLAKLVDCLRSGQNEIDWQGNLIESDGVNRENDKFIEAHIFEGFDYNAIENLIPAKNTKLSRAERLDLDIAISMFKTRSVKTP